MAELFDPVRGTSEPGRLWCITNVSEATPDILSPLCWSIWGRVLEESWLESMYDYGVISRREAVVSNDPNQHATSAIYGRQAFNVDSVRRMLARLPGVDPDDLERDLMGYVRPDRPKVRGAPQRLPIIVVKLPRALLAAHRRLHTAYAEIRRWWRTDVLEVSRGELQPKGSPIERLWTARDWFARLFKIHVTVRMQMQTVQSILTNAAAKAGDPALATKVLSGQGDILEVRLADDLWRVAQGELPEEDFIAEYGFHGPNEGNVYTRSWREDPEPLHAMVRSIAARADASRPRERERATMEAAAEAQRRLLAASSPLARPYLRFALNRARNIVRNLEIGKNGYLIGLDGCRAAARDVGRAAVAEGLLDEVDDAFFLTLEELTALMDGRLGEARKLVAYRRGTREEYRRMRLPVVFTGMPEPIIEPAAETGNGEIRGAASGGGQVTGRARVVLDPNDAVELEPGDILVCRFTDPSWAPLFTLVDGLVIDLGGAASHGAVVARELGIPYVIGTQDGTSRIADGDIIHVDGQRNLVTILKDRA